MTTKHYEINRNGVHLTETKHFGNTNEKCSSLFLVDISAASRKDIFPILKTFEIQKEIILSLQKPKYQLRFEYYDDVLYGEIPYFSILTKTPGYLVLIIKERTIFAFHESDDSLISDLIKTLTDFTEVQLSKLNISYLLYLFTVEILSQYALLNLNYREEIEELALDFDNKHTFVTPSDFLEAKSQLSNFSRVLEKLFFTLSFPPSRNIFDPTSHYKAYFEDLLKTLNLIKLSLSKTEARLNSLNDHYHLLLQERSNKRLKFLTIIQAVFVPLTLIAGIYGMNFKFMPLLEHEYGYFISLGIMGISSIAFIWYFFRNGWFDN